MRQVCYATNCAKKKERKIITFMGNETNNINGFDILCAVRLLFGLPSPMKNVISFDIRASCAVVCVCVDGSNF